MTVDTRFHAVGCTVVCGTIAKRTIVQGNEMGFVSEAVKSGGTGGIYAAKNIVSRSKELRMPYLIRCVWSTLYTGYQSL